MKKGFTMIELLVVISIIGILAAMVSVSFTSSQKQARDAQRKSDLRQYSTALEGYANKNNLYPSYIGATRAADNLCTDLTITNCPEDPKYDTNDINTTPYQYVTDGTGSGSVSATKYVLWAKLENSSYYWVVCSNGKVATASGVVANLGVCPI